VRPSTSPRRISSQGEVRSSFATAMAVAAEWLAWTTGVGSNFNLWLAHRRTLPVGPLFCIVNEPSTGSPWSPAAARTRLTTLAAAAGVRRRFAPHQLRHAHAVEMAREGVPLNVIQRQLGHANLGVTSVYLQGIDTAEIVETVRTRRGPVIPAAAALS
jgi:integrase